MSAIGCQRTSKNVLAYKVSSVVEHRNCWVKVTIDMSPLWGPEGPGTIICGFRDSSDYHPHSFEVGRNNKVVLYVIINGGQVWIMFSPRF